MPDKSVNLDFIELIKLNKMHLRQKNETRERIKISVQGKFNLAISAIRKRRKRVQRIKQKTNKLSSSNSDPPIKNIGKCTIMKKKKRKVVKKKIIKKDIGMPFSKISTLHSRRRAVLRRNFPQLASYIFMSVP